MLFNEPGSQNSLFCEDLIRTWVSYSVLGNICFIPSCPIASMAQNCNYFYFLWHSAVLWFHTIRKTDG